MGREKLQAVPLELGKGLNEKVEPLVLRPPFLERATNVRMRKMGRFDKRLAMPLLATTGLSGRPHTVFDHNGQLCSLSRENSIHRWSGTASKWTQAASASDSTFVRYPLVPCEMDAEGVTAVGTHNMSTAYHPTLGLICDVAAEFTQIIATVREYSTGAIVVGPTTLDVVGKNWAGAQVVRAGNNFLVVGATDQTLFYTWYFDATSALAWNSAAGTLLATTTTVHSTKFDLCEDATNTSICHLAYKDTATTVRVHKLTATGTSSTSVDLASNSGLGPIAIAKNASGVELYVGHSSGTGNYEVSVVETTGYTLSAGPWTAFAAGARSHFAAGIVGDSTSTRCWVALEINDDGVLANFRNVRFQRFTGSSGTGGTQKFTCYHVGLVAKPFLEGTRAFVPCCYISPHFEITAPYETANSQPMGLLLAPYTTTSDAGAQSTPCVIARFMPDRIFRRKNSDLRGLCPSASPESGVYRWLAIHDSAAFTSDRAIAVKAKFGGSPPLSTSLLEGNSLFDGGVVSYFDGIQPGENSPQWRPEIISVTSVGSGGFIAAGNYSWKAVYEWEDLQGNLHRSAPSDAKTGTAVNADSITVLLTNLEPRAYDGVNATGIKVSLYRTTVGPGTTYALASRGPATAAGTAGLLTVTDIVHDVDLGESLYTDSNALDETAPPAALDMIVHRGKRRVVLIQADDRRTIWYSKIFEDGIAPAFNAALTKRISERGTGLAELDDKIIIFSEDSIFAIFGDGPDNTGADDTFSTPNKLPSEVGCVDRNSIAVTEKGVVFKSKRGLELLTRSLEVVYVGANVEDTTASLTIHSAAVLPKVHEVRFAAASTTVIVWNYVFDAWYFHTEPRTPVHACLWSNKYVYGSYDSSTYEVSAEGTAWIDPGNTHIAATFRTPWIPVAGPQGVGHLIKIQILGIRKAAHGISASIYYNYVDSATDTKTLSESDTNLSPYQFEFVPSVQLLQAFRVQFNDAVPGAGPNEGFQLVSISVEVTEEQGLIPLPFAQRF